MRRIALGICALFLLAACGDAEADREAEREAEAQAEEQRIDDLIEDSKSACSSAVSGLQESLAAVGSKLTIGMTYADYGSELGEVRVVYDQTIAAGNLPEDAYCIAEVAIPLESALNKHVEGLKSWRSCIEERGCRFEGDRLLEVQTKWAEADGLVSQSTSALESYVNPEEYVPVTPAPAG